jgi:hypothetical protein
LHNSVPSAESAIQSDLIMIQSCNRACGRH